jgi:hypothetical protein
VEPTRVERRSLNGPTEWSGIERRSRAEHRVRVGPAWIHGWLAFESNGEKRRLAPVPDAWHELSANELERLCREAIVAPRPRAQAEQLDHSIQPNA